MAAAVLRPCSAHRAGLLGKGRVHPPESGRPRAGGQTGRLDLVEHGGILWSLPGRAETPLRPSDRPGTATGGGAKPASDLRRLDASANPTSRRPKSGVCASLFLALLGEVADEAIDLAVRCTKAGREITGNLTVALATRLRGDPDNEYRPEWTEEEQVKFPAFSRTPNPGPRTPALGVHRILSSPRPPTGAWSGLCLGAHERPGPGPAHRCFRADRQLATLVRSVAESPFPGWRWPNGRQPNGEDPTGRPPKTFA